MRGRVVSDTGPIIALGTIDQLAILKMIFDEVIVPETVHLEIMQGGENFAGHACYKKAPWIRVERLQVPMEPLLETLLDKGGFGNTLCSRKRGRFCAY